MTKVYFACSIRAGREDQPIYAELVEIIKNCGAIVLSELFGSATLMSSDHEAMTEEEIWARDMQMINEADIIIAEVTNPSLGVGYEIREAENLGKAVLALYRPGEDRRLSAMIKGSPGTKVVEYYYSSDATTAIAGFITANTHSN